jgi:hypothetical protein
MGLVKVSVLQLTSIVVMFFMSSTYASDCTAVCPHKITDVDWKASECPGETSTDKTTLIKKCGEDTDVNEVQPNRMGKLATDSEDLHIDLRMGLVQIGAQMATQIGAKMAYTVLCVSQDSGTPSYVLQRYIVLYVSQDGIQCHS